MKQLIKQWWNGKTVVVDDGGYVPRVIEQRPWLRRMHDKNPDLFWKTVLVLLSPLWAEGVKGLLGQL